MKKDDILTLNQASKYIGVSRRALLQAIKVRKTLKASKLGNFWVVEYKDADYYKQFQKGNVGRPSKKIKVKG